MTNEIKVSVAAKDSGLDNVVKDARQAGAQVGSSMDKGFDEAARAGDRASKKIRDDLGKTEKAAKDAGSGIGSALSEGLSEGLSDLTSRGGGVGSTLVGGLVDSVKSGGKAGMLGAGLAIGGLLVDGIASAVEQGKVGAAVVAATGQAGDQAGRMGRIAGELFADSFGESIQDVGEAMTSLFQNGLIDPSASDAAIAELTGKILTVSSTVEEEAGRVSRSARTMVVNGVARNVSDALDIIQRGTEKGINTAGDLLDTIDEYSIQFSRAGLSGQEAMGLISQALQGGARDADIAADAIKEFNIRAIDGSATTARGFEAIGLSAEDMSARMSRGGKSAHEALRMTLNALQAMPPGVQRSTAAVDLFGTKAEDMGDALFDMDLDTAVDEFGNFKGSVDDASRALGDSIPVWEQWGKNAKQILAEIGDGFLGLRDAADAGVDAFSGVPGGMDAVRQAQAATGQATDENTDAQGRQADAAEHTTGTIEAQIEALDKWIAKQQEAAGIVLDERDAQREYQEALDDVNESIQENGRTHDNNTESGRANNEALDDLAKSALDVSAAMEKNGSSVVDVNKHMANARQRFLATARQMGYSAEEATNLANKLGLIPRKVTVDVALRDAAARVNLAAFKRALDNIPRTITVSTYVRGANITAGGHGHMFVGGAHGGVMPHAQYARRATGGTGGGSTLINEAGGEAVKMPNGSTVLTAGATRSLAERGLLNIDGIIGPEGVTEFAATGGPRGRGVPAYRRTGQVDITAGEHSRKFIVNLLRQGWRMMDGDPDMLYSPERQRRAGENRHFSTGHAATQYGHPVLAAGSGHQPANMVINFAGDTKSAFSTAFMKMVRDGDIQIQRIS